MFTCFDLSNSEEEIDAAVLGGDYTLQAYASTHWLDHVKEGIRGDISSTDIMTLCRKIWRFLAKRSNQNFDRKSAKDVGVLELKQLERNEKDLYRELCYISSSLSSELSEPLKAPKINSELLSCLYSTSHSIYALNHRDQTTKIFLCYDTIFERSTHICLLPFFNMQIFQG